MAKTNFNDVVVDSLEADSTKAKKIIGYLKSKTIADSAALADAEKVLCLKVTASAASKVLTLGLEEGQLMILINSGATNAFTVKNISGDTGVSLAATKMALVIGGTSTADSFVCTVLN